MLPLLIDLTKPLNFFSTNFQSTLKELNQKNLEINALCGLLIAKRKNNDKKLYIVCCGVVFYAFKKHHHFLVIQNELDHRVGQQGSYVLQIDQGTIIQISFNDKKVDYLPEKYFNALITCIEQHIKNKVHLFDSPQTSESVEPQIYSCAKKHDDPLKNISHRISELSKNQIKDAIIVCGLDLYRIKAINMNQAIEDEKGKEEEEIDNFPLLIDYQTLKLAIQLAKKITQKNKIDL